MIRARAGIGYALAEALDDGHCGLPEADLIAAASKLLDVPIELIGEALSLELADHQVVREIVGARATPARRRAAAASGGQPVIFLASLAAAERQIAEQLHRLLHGKPTWPAIDADRAIPWVEAKLGMTLAPGQQQALRLAVSSKVTAITGGPGVGKTTLMNAILRVLTAKHVKPLLCAPTGRAAKRLAEATGLEAKTIHRLLEVNPRDGRFRRNEQFPLECDLLVVDETSMVDVPLMASLLRALPSHAAALFVGDVDQLPSVGPGQVLADLLTCGVVPVVRLTDVFRQAAESRIITNAHRINSGEMPEMTAKDERADFYFVDAQEPDEAARKIVQLVKGRIPDRFGLHPARDVQVLCPMNRGASGAKTLNLELQKALNPPGQQRLERFGWTFAHRRQGDADRKRLRQRGLQRRPRVHHVDRSGARIAGHRFRRPAGHVSGRGARSRRARVCDDDPQGAGLGVSGGGHSGDDAALSDAAA